MLSRMWTPNAALPTQDPTQALASLLILLKGRRFVILTGAGCSTESGIPDYRGPTGSLRRRQPIQYLDFLRHDSTRRRYWARSAAGWRHIIAARPNEAHHAIAKLLHAGHATGLITQNVDGLHSDAGSQRQVELHGSIRRVGCLGCEVRFERAAFQDELLTQNPALRDHLAAPAPDGDAELEETLARDFVVPSCRACSGVLKPDVVFFGENVPRPAVAAAWDLFTEATALLVVGSSLAVYSGFRFARGAAERGLPIVIINQGPTRADELAAVRVDLSASQALRAIAAQVSSR